MDSIHRRTNPIRTLLLCMGAMPLFPVIFASQGVAAQEDRLPAIQIRQTAKTEAGLLTLTFKTPQGKILVFLPADLRPGDTIVGSTSLEPAGRKDEDKDSNRALLVAYAFSLAGQTHSIQEASQKWSLPADLKPEGAIAELMDGSRREAARVELPLTDVGARLDVKSGLPKNGQPGRALIINQAFLPGSEDLHVLIGDREARLIAASPRMVAVESPRDVLGKTLLQVKRGGELLAEGDFRNRRGRSVNPWPYVIGVILIGGTIIAIEAAKSVSDLSNLKFGPGPFF